MNTETSKWTVENDRLFDLLREAEQDHPVPGAVLPLRPCGL